MLLQAEEQPRLPANHQKLGVSPRASLTALPEPSLLTLGSQISSHYNKRQSIFIVSATQEVAVCIAALGKLKNKQTNKKLLPLNSIRGLLL